MTTLILSSRHTEDDQALWRAAIKRGWSVERARGLHVPEVDPSSAVLYVESLFAHTIAAQLGVTLLEAPEDWLVRLPTHLTNRSIQITTLGEVRDKKTPAFIKPPNDKSFAADVYKTGAELPNNFDDDTTVLVSDPVEWQDEFRCFCLDGVVQTISPYLRSGVLAKESQYAATDSELKTATLFAERVLSESKFTPNAVVIDVGTITGRGWSVVEANAAWGSGIYGCNTNSVLNVIRQATIS